MTSTTSACPEIGAWRAWLDHEATALDLSDHLDDCPGCQELVADLRDGALTANSTLARLAPSSLPSNAEAAMALQRLKAHSGRAWPAPSGMPGREPVTMARGRTWSGWRLAGSGIAAALALSVVVAFTPEGRTAAAGFLAQFRSQQVAAIEVSPQTQSDIVRTMNALSNLGTLQTPAGLGAARPETVARGAAAQARTVSLAEAAQTVGFSLQTPDPALLRPLGIDQPPTVQVVPANQVRFTFDKAKAGAYFKSTGHPEVNLPDKFDGATLIVSIPSAALLQYGNSNAREALVVGEAGELVVDVQGKVSLDELRDFLLGLPGLPESTVSQLRQIKNWNDTLPIPVPIDRVNWQQTDFNGNQGLLLNDNSGVGSAAIWHAGGHLYGLAGSLKASDLARVARSFAVR
jgi:hypothetical protein